MFKRKKCKIKFRVIDETGDSVAHFTDTASANARFSDLMRNHIAYDAGNLEVINKITPANQEVIFHRKIVAG